MLFVHVRMVEKFKNVLWEMSQMVNIYCFFGLFAFSELFCLPDSGNCVIPMPLYLVDSLES